MYAIIYENRVISQQERWNVKLFNSILLEECETTKQLGILDEQTLPITINAKTKVMRVIQQKDTYDPEIEYLDGPNYEIGKDIIIARFDRKPLDLEIAKGNKKDLLPNLRYTRENKNINVFVQGKSVTISASRANRATLTNKSLIINEDVINWKFPEGWFSLTKEDVDSILSQIDFHVQEAFDWEISKTNEINACKTLDQVKQVKVN